MENAHVLIRLRDGDTDPPPGSRDTAAARSPTRSDVGVRRTSATSVRLEHSDMSPGVASINFEQVFDHCHANGQIFEQSLASAVRTSVLGGSAMTVVATGAADAGKSYCMHGGREADAKDSKGLVELAIEHAFAVVSEYHEWQVLLAFAYTQRNAVEKSRSLVDAVSGEPVPSSSADPASVHDSTFLSRAVRVENAGEAIQGYKSALVRSSQTARRAAPSTDFVCVVFVESRAKSGVLRRSRLSFIDVHGDSIIEPTLSDHQDDEVKPALFGETHFPVNELLTKWCGAWLGNHSATFFLVAIQTSKTKQQLAIQSLLYACKAKEIKSRVEPCELDKFSVIPAYADAETVVDEPEGHDGVITSLRSPLSSAPSVPTTPNRHASASDLLSERLRQAYESVKRSSTKAAAEMSPRVKTVQLNEPVVVLNAGATMQQLHAKADAILNTSQSRMHDLETMTLLEKLDAISKQHRDVEASLRHETSVKKKCVERISKLSQTMSFQVVEHEKLLKAKDTDNNALREQLEVMQSRYDDAEDTLDKLQAQVEAMKVAMRERAHARSPVKTSTNERVLLQQFSARLETAMLEAKAVVDHKDKLIRDLEVRAEQLRKANDVLELRVSTTTARSREEESRWTIREKQWENEKARWAEEKTKWDVEMARWRKESNTWAEEKARLIKENTDWQVKNDRWQLEIAREKGNAVNWVAKQAEWERAEANWMKQKAELSTAMEAAHKQAEANWIEAEREWRKEKGALEGALVSCQEQVKIEKRKTIELQDRLVLSERELSMKVSDMERVTAEWEKARGLLGGALAACQEQMKIEIMRSKELEDRLALSEREWSARVSELEQAIEDGQREWTLKRNDDDSQREGRIAELEITLRAQESHAAQAQEKLNAMEAAKAMTEQQVTVLQAKLDMERTLFAKEKKKLDKKLRILMNERKQQLEDADKVETEMALEVQRLGLQLEASQSECQAKDAELDRTRSQVSDLRGQLTSLEKQHFVSDELERTQSQLSALQERLAGLEKQRSVSEEQIAVLHDCNTRLETDKRAIQAALERLEQEKQRVSDELERRTCELEQRAARQLMEREATLSMENEHKLRDVMDRHASELLQRDLELRRLRARRPVQPPPVSSSSSSSSSSSFEQSPRRQHDLEQLGTVGDTPESSADRKRKDKRRDDKLAKQKLQLTALRTQVDSLTHGLAVANEQESLAKEAMAHQQLLYERMMFAQEELQLRVNILKEENWLLSLALQVTEKREDDKAFLPMSSRIAECQ